MDSLKKYEGFPCFLIEGGWYRKHLNYLNNKKVEGRTEYPGPITNFSIINHIYEIVPYEQKFQ